MGRRVLTALLVCSLLLLLGCGRSGDRFIGTWRNTDPATKPDTRLVIWKAADGYRLAAYDESGKLPVSWTLVRRGDELSGTFVPAAPSRPIKLVVTYRPASGHLLMRESVGPVVELEKVSDSTAMPQPSATP